MDSIVGKKAINIFEKELNEDNFILFHSTTIKNAESIMRTGLKMMNNTTITIKPKSDPIFFATYSLKEISPEEAVNVIIEIPIKDIWGSILKGYNIVKWIEKLRKNNKEEYFVRTLLENEEIDNNQVSLFNTKTVLPNYFIKGYVKIKDRKIVDIDKENIDIRKIIFIPNPEAFSNIGLVKQQEVINYYHNKYKKIMNKE